MFGVTKQGFTPTGLWILLLSSTAQRLGSPNAVTYISSSDFISAVSTPSSTFAGVTSSQTLKFWNKPRSLSLKLYYWNTITDRQDMFAKWRTIVYQRLLCMVNYPLVTKLVRHGSGPWCLATFNPQSCQQVWARQKKCNKRQEKRKAWAVSNTTPDVTFTCRHCSQPCLYRIGLVSHECACSRGGQTS